MVDVGLSRMLAGSGPPRYARPMSEIRRRLYGLAWALYVALLGVVWMLRDRLPERLPALIGADWSDRDVFFSIQFALLGLILLFSAPIDGLLLRRSGENAFLAAITLFMTLVFALILLPVLFVGLSLPRAGLAWSLAAAVAVGGCAGLYRMRMGTLRGQALQEGMDAAYYRKIRPGWSALVFPLAFPFYPYSVALDSEGIRVKGALMDCRWKWGQVGSVAPGKAVQAYAGMAIRLTASGHDLVVINLKEQKWPVVLNAPDREAFFEAFRRLAPKLPAAGAENAASE